MVSNKVIHSLEKDDRVPRNLPKLQDKLWDGLSFLSLLPLAIWLALAPWAGFDVVDDGAGLRRGGHRRRDHGPGLRGP